MLLLWEFTALQPLSLSYCLSRHSTSGFWTWQSLCLQRHPLQGATRHTPSPTGSTQASHLCFKGAFLAPLPKLLSELFPIVCVSLSCFLSPSPYTLYTHTHTHTHTQIHHYIYKIIYTCTYQIHNSIYVHKSEVYLVYYLPPVHKVSMKVGNFTCLVHCCNSTAKNSHWQILIGAQ